MNIHSESFNLLNDLLESAMDMQNLNQKELENGLNELSDYEQRIITEQVIKLADALNVNHHIYLGKRVARGVIAGTKLKDHKVCSALVAGKDFHEWQAIEDIER